MYAAILLCSWVYWIGTGQSNLTVYCLADGDTIYAGCKVQKTEKVGCSGI